MAARYKQTARKSTGGQPPHFRLATAWSSMRSDHSDANNNHVGEPDSSPENSTGGFLSPAARALQEGGESSQGSNSLSNLSSPEAAMQWQNHVHSLVNEIFNEDGAGERFNTVHRLLDRYVFDKTARRLKRMHEQFNEKVEERAVEIARTIGRLNVPVVKEELKEALSELVEVNNGRLTELEKRVAELLKELNARK